MERTTIMLPHDLKARASERARQMGMSFGQFVRESLAVSLDIHEKIRPMEDPLFADDEVFHGEIPADFSRNHDDYLYGDDY